MPEAPKEKSLREKFDDFMSEQKAERKLKDDRMAENKKKEQLMSELKKLLNDKGGIDYSKFKHIPEIPKNKTFTEFKTSFF